jgi:hypothetical protein
MSFRSIPSQFVLETLVFLGIALVAAIPRRARRDVHKALGVLTALHVLRFGGVVAALAAAAESKAPAFLVEVAIGDGLAATFAVVALVLLRRRSVRAAVAVGAMNLVGLMGILVSETWLTCLEQRGDITRSTFLHGPTLGAALYATLHVLAFYLLLRGSRDTALVTSSRKYRAPASASVRSCQNNVTDAFGTSNEGFVIASGRSGQRASATRRGSAAT